MTEHSYVLEICQRVSQICDAERRREAIGRECGEDEALRAAVEAHLRGDQSIAERAMLLGDTDEPSVSPPHDPPDVDQTVVSATGPGGAGPDRIGQFSIRRIIGTGGMGTVYEAMQDSPRRKVALKVMKPGLTSRSAARRFEYESQILGRLRHVAIAEVYEAGHWDDGSGGVPYFAMEYIPGARTLTEWVEQKSPTIQERIELFIKICDAVHHGHAKGIIHRDLKPGNILVDMAGNPRVIDFGIARATDSDMAVTTLQTDVGQLLGTLQYMSPEQCEADPDILDTRSDVYALGVILFEMLSGSLPYDVSTVPVYEAARIVKESSATRMTTIDKTLGGDVETIVGKAMEKDRDRRYQSAMELKTDLERYLQQEPILARPPSIAYQVSLFTRRNKALVSSIVAIFIVLVITTAWSLVERDRASDAAATAIAAQAETQTQLDRAVLAEEETQTQLDRAVVAEAATQEQLDRAVAAEAELRETVSELEVARNDAVRGFQLLLEVAGFTDEILSMGAPRNAQGRELTAHDLVRQAVGRIDEKFKDRPTLEAPARAMIGKLLREYGDLELAEAQLTRAVELFNDMDTPERTHEQFAAAANLAQVYADLGDAQRAEFIASGMLEAGTESLGQENVSLLQAKSVLADLLELNADPAELPLRQEIAKGMELATGPTSEETLEAKVRLVKAKWNATFLSSANLEEEYEIDVESQIRELIPVCLEHLGSLHPVTVEAKVLLGGFLAISGRAEEAEPLVRQGLEDTQQLYGRDHIQTAMASTGAGIMLIMLGNGQDAEPILREAISIFNDASSNHPMLYQAYSFLGSSLMGQERFHEAAPMLRQVREEAVASGAEEMTMVSMNTALGVCLLFTAEFEEGEPIWQRGLDGVRAVSGDHGPGALNMHFARAMAYLIHEREGGVDLARESVQQHLAHFGVDHPWTRERSLTFAAVLNERDQPEAAMELIELFTEAARGSEKEDEEVSIAQEMIISEIYQSLGEMDRAEEVLRDAMERAYALLGPGGGVAIGSACKLAQLLSKEDRRDEAMELLWATWESASAELGTEHRLARYPETLLINLNVSRDWDVVDEVMGARFDRLQDDSELLREDAINLATNGHEAFKDRYQDLAMDAARRVVELEGQQDADATFLLGSIAFLYDDLDEARPWLVKAMDLAGDGLSDVLTQWREAAQWSDERMITWDIKVAAMLEEIGEPDRSEQILRDAAEWAMTRQGPGGAEAVGSAVQLARHLARHDRLDEATEMLREIRASAAAELGPEHRVALLPETAMINLYVDRDWEVVDELMAARLERQWDDDQALQSFAINLATNSHEVFKARCRDLAMKAARRVDELGEFGVTDATYLLATVAYYYQEYDLAMRTLEKAIANADDASDEELDLLRDRLEEVRSIVRGESS